MSEEQKPGTPTGKSITHEEFVQLEIVNLRTDRIKARLWEIERFAENAAQQIQQIQAAVEMRPQLEQLQQQFAEARNNHDLLVQELNNSTQQMNEVFASIMEPYDVSNQRVLIEDTEPHEIRIL